jgi:hypothetical protein
LAKYWGFFKPYANFTSYSRELKKPISLYKFNSFGITNEEYKDLVVREWKHFIKDGELAMKYFKYNLVNINKLTWD